MATSSLHSWAKKIASTINSKLLMPLFWRTKLSTTFAKAYIKKYRHKKVKIIAVTGSAGKTTTKDICAEMLQHMYLVTKTLDSSNDTASVANTLLSIRTNDHYAVLEVAAANPGMMQHSLKLFKPEIAVVTLIQKEHVRQDYNLEQICTEKFRLVEALPNHGIAVLNIDDPLLRKKGLASNKKVIWIGRSQDATIQLVESHSVWPHPLTLKIIYNGQPFIVNTNIHGNHLALPVLCSLGVGLAIGIGLEKSIELIAKQEPSEGRMQVVTARHGVTFVRDDWKAPYWSLSSPLAFIKEAKAQRKLVIIGTLSDYSRSASKLYPQVAKQALSAADIVVFVGPHAHRATKKVPVTDRSRIFSFSSLHYASQYLDSTLRSGDLILLKGTNKVDHLVRLVINWDKKVACWDDKCRKEMMCTRCPLLHNFAAPCEKDRLSKLDFSAQPEINLEPQHHFVLIGLGNYNEKYHQTWHNTGHIALDALARKHNASWKETQYGIFSEVLIKTNSVILVKLKSTINDSGPAVRRMLGTQVLGKKLIVVHDDTDIPFRKIKIQDGGGDCGHLGVRSLIDNLNDQRFIRIRIGCRAEKTQKAAALVHESITEDKKIIIEDLFFSSLERLITKSPEDYADSA